MAVLSLKSSQIPSAASRVFATMATSKERYKGQTQLIFYSLATGIEKVTALQSPGGSELLVQRGLKPPSTSVVATPT
jgi:hypothetical protein